MTRTVPTHAAVGQKCWEDRPETCALTPPDDVSILVYRVVFCCIMVELTQHKRDFLMNWEPPQTPLMPRGTMLIVDSHTHLDWIIAKTGGQPWLVEGVPRHPPGHAMALKWPMCVDVPLNHIKIKSNPGHAWSLPPPVHHL